MFRDWLSQAEIVEIGESGRTIGYDLGALFEQRLKWFGDSLRTNGRYVGVADKKPCNLVSDVLLLWHLGKCPVIISADSTKFEVQDISDSLGLPAIVYDDGVMNCAARDAAAPHFEEHARRRAADPRRPILDRPAVVLLTSGSTGRPQGVVHSFRGLLARLSLNVAHIGPRALARTLCFLPLHFGHGLIGNFLTPIFAGGRMFLIPGTSPAFYRDLPNILSRYRITFLSSVPSFWPTLFRFSDPPQRTHLRRVHVGSAPLSRRLWQEVVEWTGTRNVVNAYGLTETANWVAGASASKHEPEDGLVGRPWGGAAAVRDAHGVVRRSGDGEIVLRSPSLAIGFLAQAGRVEPPDECDDGWFRTGDTGTLDEHGNIRISGRLSFQIKRAGIRVSPEEVEMVLHRHPAVLDACVFGVPDDVLGERLGVAVVLDRARPPDVDSLRLWTRERLQPIKRPDDWFVVPTIPRTDRGKVDRRSLAAVCLARRGPR